MSAVTLVATLHDPDDRQLAQAQRVLPLLHDLYAAIVVLASARTSQHSLAALRAGGVRVHERPDGEEGIATLGTIRRAALEFALATPPDHLHFCDWDRIIHWAEAWPEELSELVPAIPGYDFLILGRTSRAFASHPQVQRDTERLINHAFGLAWGQPLDITAAARGISRRAAVRIIAGCLEPSLGNDGSWPLFLARDPAMEIGYAMTEGLEWETPDRYAAEIAQMGSLDAWIAAFDANLDHWAERIQLAQLEVAAIARWSKGKARSTD